MLNEWRGTLPVLQRSLHQPIVQSLGQRIVQGEWKPGDVLPNEHALSTAFGVSRTVLREATRILAEKGLVESRPKIGTRIRPRSAWNLLDADVLDWSNAAEPDLQFLRNLCEVRMIIEPAAAEFAAVRASPAELDLMAECLARMDAATASAEGYIVADLRFHAAILAASHNELLEQMTKTISVALTLSRRITVQLEGGAQAYMPSHRAVYDAIRARDAAAARTAMLRLIVSTLHGMEQVLGQPLQP